MSASFGYSEMMMGVVVELWVGSMSLLFIIGWKALCIDCVDCAPCAGLAFCQPGCDCGLHLGK